MFNDFVCTPLLTYLCSPKTLAQAVNENNIKKEVQIQTNEIKLCFPLNEHTAGFPGNYSFEVSVVC